jgi:hypothetical protein
MTRNKRHTLSPAVAKVRVLAAACSSPGGDSGANPSGSGGGSDTSPIHILSILDKPGFLLANDISQQVIPLPPILGAAKIPLLAYIAGPEIAAPSKEDVWLW